MQEVELVHAECAHPPLHDDVSDESLSEFYDSNISEDDDEIQSYHDSPSQPKWAEKSLEAARNIAGNPLDPRKTRSQFHNAFSACELNIVDSFLMMVGYDPHTYQEASLTEYDKQTCKKSSSPYNTMRLENWFPFPPRGN